MSVRCGATARRFGADRPSPLDLVESRASGSTGTRQFIQRVNRRRRVPAGTAPDTIVPRSTRDGRAATDNETCVPREDVREGQLTDAHFAAQLDQIVRDPERVSGLRRSRAFFELTYPTTGLKRPARRRLRTTERRQGRGRRARRRPLETSFGGGQAHGLIAVYHLAKGARPSNVAEFVDPSLLPDDCQIAAVVGDALDPVTGVETNGINHAHDLGRNRRPAGPRGVLGSALRTTSSAPPPAPRPGARRFGGRPTIIVIDELAAVPARPCLVRKSDVRRMAEAVPAFLKSLLSWRPAIPTSPS